MFCFQFRNVVAKFTVVETFNANLSNLQVDGLTVPLNPFTTEELDVWLDVRSQIIIISLLSIPFYSYINGIDCTIFGRCTKF